MTAQDALRAALRDVVAPAARSHGFRGTAPTWRRTSPRGDWAIVTVQSSAFSSRSSLTCVINVAVAPAPWLDWVSERDGSPLPKKPSVAHGLWQSRLHPTGTRDGCDVWWEVGQADGDEVAADMVRQLDSAGWPLLELLLERDELMARATTGELPFRYAAELLLADRGPGRELDARLDEITLGAGPDDHLAERFVRWARARASSVGRA